VRATAASICCFRIELAAAARRRWPELRVVLTSGYSHVLAEQGTHGFEFLAKPYSAESLVKMLGLDMQARPQPGGASPQA
jgi:hypothetical protein